MSTVMATASDQTFLLSIILL